MANADRFLPYADASFRVVASITARRNAVEFRRVLREDGTLLVVVPAPDDLIELRAAVLGEGVMRDRVADAVESLAPLFALARRERFRRVAHFDADAVRDAMSAPIAGSGRVSAAADLPRRPRRHAEPRCAALPPISAPPPPSLAPDVTASPEGPGVSRGAGGHGGPFWAGGGRTPTGLPDGLEDHRRSIARGRPGFAGRAARGGLGGPVRGPPSKRTGCSIRGRGSCAPPPRSSRTAAGCGG